MTTARIFMFTGVRKGMVSKMKEKKIRNIIVIAAALVVSAILSVAFIKLARQQHR